MRGLKMVGSRRPVYVESIEAAHQGVIAIWPAMQDPNDVVAEAWIHRDRPGWWLRIRSREPDGSSIIKGVVD